LSDTLLINEFSPAHITTDTITSFSEKKIAIDVLRLDKIHPQLSGNKWFKLRYYIEAAQQQQKKTILTFGGAWSNHIVATAAACNLKKIKSIGIIRGEEAGILSPTLQQAKALGMQLVLINRTDYKNKQIPAAYLTSEVYTINEGGYGILGMKGAATILNFATQNKYTTICCAVGTGTMIAGLITAAEAGQKIIGISVLKNNFEIENKIAGLIERSDMSYHINHDYHFGGYANYQPALIDFMNKIYSESKIPTDFVYTGKLFYGINDLLSKNSIAADNKILLIHSGGLQGNASLDKGMLIY